MYLSIVYYEILFKIKLLKLKIFSLKLFKILIVFSIKKLISDFNFIFDIIIIIIKHIFNIKLSFPL